jgi:DNA-binding LacI/PurR family transcriptional regulator/signal transduction histidine kinase
MYMQFRNGHGKRPTIGMLLGGIGDYHLELWAGVAEAARVGDANLLMFIGNPLGTGVPLDLVDALANATTIDGLIVPTGSISILEAKGFSLHQHYAHLPLVTVSKSLAGFSSVMLDNARGLRDLLIHLIDDHGYRRVAFISGPTDHLDARERYQVYEDTLRAHNLALNEDLIVPGDFSTASGARAIQLLLDERQVGFDAVVAANDLMAHGALQELRARGIDVPRQVALAGFDDHRHSRLTLPPLTTVRQPTLQVGREAVALLLAQLVDAAATRQITLPTQLIIRESCGCTSPAVLRAAADGIAADRQTPQDAAAAVCRAAQLEAGSPEAVAVERIWNAFWRDWQYGQAGDFLDTLQQTWRELIEAGNKLQGWQDLLSWLRQQAVRPVADITRLRRAEDLWHQARVMLEEMQQQADLHHHIQIERQTAALRDIGQILSMTLDGRELLDTMAQRFPELGITRCYLNVYEADSPKTDEQPYYSRLLMAYTEAGRLPLPDVRLRFPSSQLLPADLPTPDRRWALLVIPLHFREQELGFLLCEHDRPDEYFYRVLRSQISLALQGALLMQRLRLAQDALQKTNVALEQRVSERTAALQRSQQTLQEFQRQLIALHALSIELARAPSVDELCRRAVEEGRSRLGFDRLGVWFVDSDRRSQWGVFGTDERGQTRDERGLRLELDEDVLPIVRHRTPAVFHDDVPIYDQRHQIVGQGWRAAAALWDGDYVIGQISADNLLSQQPCSAFQVELLTLYGITLGQLCTRKRSEAERERLIAELEAKNSELERFTYTVSHDLKSPLITIRGFLGLLEKDALAGDSERLRADMARIVEATDKMRRLLEELLELSRIGRMLNPPQVVSFEAVVREALDLVRGSLEARGVTVQVANGLPQVYGDRTRLVEVVQNLVDNAAKFMGAQSEPRIEIGHAGTENTGKPIFFVRDNGSGIEPQYHQKVFGLFDKLDPHSDGTGIGLALVKRIVEVQGGRIWIESEGRGKGSTFFFALPGVP